MVGDFTGNGKLDIAVPAAINFQDALAVFLGNGDGTFQPPIITTVDLPGPLGKFDLVHQNQLAAGDFDNDGKLDLVGLDYPSQQPEQVVFLSGNGDGTFKPAVPFSPGIQSGSSAFLGVGDFTGSGKLDVAVVTPEATVVRGTPPAPGAAPDVLSVLLGNGDGTFQPATTSPIGQLGAAGLAVADINSDGKLDLITADSQSGDVSVLFGNGNGNGTFQAPEHFPVGINPSSVAVGDFDGDGSPDLAVAFPGSNSVGVLLGSATPVVTAVADAPLSATGTTISANAGTSFTGVVATLSEASATDPAGDFSATIAWGDGTTSAGTITATSSGSFQVSGTKTYAAAGTFRLAVTIHDKGGAQAQAAGTAAVAQPLPTSTSIVAAGVAISGYERKTFTGAAVATFTDGDGSLPVSAFTASIDWGDGTTSARSVSLAGGTYTVTGSHTYLDEGKFTVKVAIEQGASSAPSSSTSATVSAVATVHEELLAEGTSGTPNQRFVSEIYRDLLFRQAEPQGREFWVAQLAAGESRADLAFAMAKLAFPREYQHDTVTALYHQYLHRDPDPQGSAFWASFLFDGGTIEGMSQALVSSPEYNQVRSGGKPEAFLDNLFRDALGRPIDPGGRAFFEGLMSQGTTFAAVAAIVFHSQEYRDLRVTALVEQFLDRPAGASELDTFAAQLAAGVRDEQVIAELIATDEYFAKAQS